MLWDAFHEAILGPDSHKEQNEGRGRGTGEEGSHLRCRKRKESHRKLSLLVEEEGHRTPGPEGGREDGCGPGPLGISTGQ